MADIAVLGAGVVGLSTALNIQKLLPNVKVRIIADQFYRETTSYGAGGIFLPTTEEIPGVPEKILRKWCRGSWEFYSSLALSAQAAETGHEVAHGYVPCKKRKEKILLPSDNYYNHSQHLLTMLVGQYDVVVNCTGFGSKRLFNDNKMTPVRGQLLRGYKLDHEWVGLRPSRTPVRLEKETLQLQNGNLKVVHNYGHGANGIALSWGTGLEAAKLVKEILYNSHVSKL
ncbi:hypothetical protein KUTeg_019533 [Tegillarca granosa]|uniref:FAD dependent oxidoreductase domain-containing protein n=1 Tax=Tegillarca granosa TaxID=220873 RepID=A0ABQ9EGV1_TEGGR|nr:hypothetical protein KUTeg_019533 [Tegillarca granosa]